MDKCPEKIMEMLADVTRDVGLTYVSVYNGVGQQSGARIIMESPYLYENKETVLEYTIATGCFNLYTLIHKFNPTEGGPQYLCIDSHVTDNSAVYYDSIAFRGYTQGEHIDPVKLREYLLKMQEKLNRLTEELEIRRIEESGVQLVQFMKSFQQRRS